MQPSNTIPPKYTYINAGFNNFLSRSKKANPFAQILSDGASSSSGTTVNFDRQQIAASLGNVLKLGRISLDGVSGRIAITDKTDTTETAWFGDLTG